MSKELQLNLDDPVTQAFLRICASGWMPKERALDAEDIVAHALEERDRLRAEVQEGADALLRTHRILSTKEAENAAMREIAEVFVASALHYRADPPDSLNAWYECLFCMRTDRRLMASEFPHAEDCPVTKARELLGKSSE